jgi:hypothetical protein
LLAYLTEDLADAYVKLFSAAKGVQQVLSMTGNVTGGGGASLPIDIPAFADAGALGSWVEKVAPSPAIAVREPDVLDALVLWSRAIMRELDRRSQYETEFTVAIPLTQPAGSRGTPLLTNADMKAAFTNAGASGSVNFVLDASVLPFGVVPTALRVVGVGLTVEHDKYDAVPVQYSPGFPHTPSNPVVQVGQTPAASQEPTQAQADYAQTFAERRLARLNATITSPPQATPGAANAYQRPPILLPQVRIQGGMSGDLEPQLCYDPACRNLSPFGKWTVSINPNLIDYYLSSGVLTDTWVDGLILYLRLRGMTA